MESLLLFDLHIFIYSNNNRRWRRTHWRLVCWLSGGLACGIHPFSVDVPVSVFVCVFCCLSEWPFSYLSDFFLPICNPLFMSLSPVHRKCHWHCKKGNKAMKCPHKLMQFFILKKSFSIFIPTVLWRELFVVEMTEWLMQNKKKPSPFHFLYASLYPLFLWLTLSTFVQLYLSLPLCCFPPPFPTSVFASTLSISFLLIINSQIAYLIFPSQDVALQFFLNCLQCQCRINSG